MSGLMSENTAAEEIGWGDLPEFADMTAMVSYHDARALGHDILAPASGVYCQTEVIAPRRPASPERQRGKPATFSAPDSRDLNSGKDAAFTAADAVWFARARPRSPFTPPAEPPTYKNDWNKEIEASLREYHQKKRRLQIMVFAAFGGIICGTLLRYLDFLWL